MIDRDKVIRALEYLISEDCTDNQFDYADEIETAIALLKEQEPKPVELHTNAYGTKFYFCPKCKRELFHTRNLNFCERCGQGVKWDD